MACAPREVQAPEPVALPVAAAPSTIADAEKLDTRSLDRETQRDFNGALDDAKQALTIRERLLPPDDVAIGRSLLRIARVYWMMGNYPELDNASSRALTALEAKLGPDAVDVARALFLRGSVILHERRYRDASPLFDRALAIFEKANGVDVDLFETICNTAVVAHGNSEYQRAITIYQRSLDFGQKRFGAESWRLGWPYGGIGEAYRMMGDYTRARTNLECAVALHEQAPYVRYLSVSLNNLANLHYTVFRDYEKAEQLYRRAIEISESIYGTDDINTGQEYMNLASMLMAKGDFDNGEPLYKKGLDIFERKLGADHKDYVFQVNHLTQLRMRKP